MASKGLSRAFFAVARHRLFPSVVIVAAGLWLTRNYWLPGRYVIAFDTYTYSGPNSVITAEAVRHWRLPLINEFIFGGATHFGNPQNGVMYPPRLLTAFVETNRAMGYLVAVHVVWLGWGMRRFLRSLAVGEVGAVFASVALMMSGAVLTKAGQFEQIIVVAWLPWLLLAILRVMEPVGETMGIPAIGRRVAVLALVTAAVCSAGHPQMTYEIAVASVFFVITLALIERHRTSSWRRAGRRFLGVAAGVGLGTLVVIPQLWASLLATRDSQLSSGRDLESLETSSLALTVRASARALLGSIRQVSPDMFVGSFEAVSYVGVTVGLLALFGFVSVGRGRNGQVWLYGFGILGLFSLIMALGPRTFLFRWAFAMVPGFDLGRVSARWLVISTFVLCVAAAVGLENLKRRVPRSSVMVVSGAAVVGFVFVFGVTNLPDRFTLVSWLVLAALVVGVLAVASRTTSGRSWSIVVVALAICEMYAISLPWHSPVEPAGKPFTEVRSDLSDWLSTQSGYTVALTEDFGPIDEIIQGLRPNTNVLLGIRSIDGYDGGVQVTKRWSDALGRFSVEPDPELPLRSAVRSPLDPGVAARTGIRFVLVDRRRIDPVVGIGWGSPTRSEGIYDLYENPEWQGEARVWGAARAFRRSEIQAVLRGGGVDADVALVESPLEKLPETCRAPCDEPDLIVVRERPEKVSISGEFTRPSLVTFPMQAGPGWEAAVDGIDSPVVPLDGLFLGTEVPAGRHTIVFEYRPAWLMPTVIVSVLALMVNLWLIRPRRSRRVPLINAPIGVGG